MKESITVLSIESPWPSHSGYAKRVMDIARQLAKEYSVSFVILRRQPLAGEQLEYLRQYANEIHEIRRCDASLSSRLAVAALAIFTRLPYHAALIEHSFNQSPQTERIRPKPTDIVYANTISWCAPLCREVGSRWILDQHNADVELWRGYARHSRNLLVRVAAYVNGWLTRSFCRRVYPNVSTIISVCEEDARLTRNLTSNTPISVIENGVDCSYFRPKRQLCSERGATILFTGTSVARNMKALRYFVRQVYPLVRQMVPACQLTIGGSFGSKARQEFSSIPKLHFTGTVKDMRPIYDRSAVYICPFDDAYGSKLKVSEALAMGQCIVSTTAGVRGMPVRSGESVVIADETEEMARTIARLLSGPAEALAVGHRARNVAETYLDWDTVLGPRLRAIVADVCKREISEMAAIPPHQAIRTKISSEFLRTR